MTDPNPEAARYMRLHELFALARELETPERQAFLREHCAEDRELRQEVEELLESHDAEVDRDAFSESRISDSRQALEGLLDEGAGDQGDGEREWLPERIGRYTITKRLGEGGMGIVYEALQESPRRQVAIKLLHPLHATPERLRRFRQEAELLGRLRHPGIAQIFEAGTYDLGRGAQPYFAMERVAGTDLRTYAADHRLHIRARLELVARVCDAVQYAHEQGVIHRDIKPENVLVDADGQPKVLDFGIARASTTSTLLSTIITEEGQLVGTLAYMAPEQLQRSEDAITPKVDVYALGVLSFELLTGRLPHEISELPISVAIGLIANTDPPAAGKLDSSLRGDVEVLLGRALETEPARRYASPAAFAADVRRYLEDRPILARRPSRIYLARKFTRRHRGLTLGAVATFLTLTVGVIVALFLARLEREQRSRADANALDSRRNEVHAVAGLMRAGSNSLDRGRWLEGLEQLEAVREGQRDWAWQLERLRAPNLLDVEFNLGWSFVDAEHLLRHDFREGHVWLHSISRSETWIAHSGLSEAGRSRVTRSGLLLAGDAEAVHLIDVFEGVARASWPHPGDTKEAAPTDRIGSGSAVSDDGRVVILHTRTFDRAEVWVDGALRWTVDLSGVPEGLRGDCQVSPDGAHVIVNRHAELGWLDLETGEEQRVAPSEGFDGLRGTPGDGRWECLHISGSSVARTLQPYSAGMAPAPPAETNLGLESMGNLRWSTDGSLQARTTWGAFHILDGEGHGPVSVSAYQDEDGRISNPSGYVIVSEFSRDSRRILAQLPNRAPWLIDLSEVGEADDLDPRSSVLRGHTEWVYYVATSPDGSMIASAAPWDPFIRLWDAYAMEEIAALERRARTPGSDDALLAFSPDGDRFVASTALADPSGIVVVEWKLASGARQIHSPEVPVPSPVHAPILDLFLEILDPQPLARLSQKAQMVGDKAMSVWRSPMANDQSSTARQPAEGGRRWVPVPDPEFAGKWDTVALTVHPDGERVAIVSVDVPSGTIRASSGRIAIRDLATGELERLITTSHQPWCAAFSPDGKLLAIGTHGSRLLVLETEFWTTRLDIRAHDRYVYSLAWMPDGIRLVTASGDATLKVWDPRPPDVKRAEREEWLELRASMRARPGLADELGSLTGLERAAARVELVRRWAAPPAGD